MGMIIFNLIVFFNVNVSSFSYFFDPIMSFSLILMIDLFIIIFYFIYLYIYLFFCWAAWGIFLGVILFLMDLSFLVCEFVFL